MLSLLSTQFIDERDRKSAIIQKKLFGTPSFLEAGTVCFYVSLPMEVSTHAMIGDALASGKKVLVPAVDLKNKELHLKEIRDFKKDLAPGTLGILEPVSRTKSAELGEAQCFVVPALAFDVNGHRLGRGGGFYDRLLAQLPTEVSTIGLAFSFQVFPEIPLQSHDRPVNMVLTEQ